LLVVLGLILFLLEIKVASYGLLTLGGFACLLTGLLMMFPRDVPALRVSPAFVVPLSVAMAAVMGLFVVLVVRAQRAPVATGRAGMLGELGQAASELDPRGKVQVHGEIWNALARAPIARGERVRVVAVEGLQLLVERPVAPDEGIEQKEDGG